MAFDSEINRLVILIVSGRQAGEVMQQLTRHRFYFTRIDSSGGVFQEPTECLLIGLNSERMVPLLRLVRKYCKVQKQYIPARMNMPMGYSPMPMIEAQFGGALIYTMDVEHFEQI